ncbi:hypothetical protein ACHAXT_008744 [Thalassiosira profunda]
MFPTFEPSTPREPQWFPRPITDSIESSLDLLERLEEDRRRRLRGIANVAARTPIGLGGVEDRAHSGAASHVSPKRGHGSNNYSRHRYYPPPSEASASLHASYHSDRLQMNATPASVTARSRARNRQRNSRSPANTAGREGARTPADGASPGGHSRTSLDRGMYVADASTFASPPLDPRAGGGSVVRGPRAVRRIPSPRHYLPAAQQMWQQRSFESGSESFRIDTAATPTAGSEEFVTPPAMAGVGATPGHGRGEDVYSQRCGASQRRRRRGWDEVEVDI